MKLYDAFISYSHSKDKPIAAALQSVVQKLGKPWYRRRALRVFRDDTSLSATPSLWPAIEQALGKSRYFILLASPEAAASKWVNKEVAHWLDHNGAETLLIGVTGGDLAWDESVGDFTWREEMPLPPVLAGRFAAEPKWVDLRAYRDGADPRDARLIEAGADFAAAIREIPKEDLLSQEVRQQRRALTLAWSAAASLLILAGVAGWQWYQADVQRSEAIIQRNRAEQTLATATKTANGLVFDLAQRFRNTIGVPAALIKDILDRALNLQGQLMASGQVTPELRASEGDALIQGARALLNIGDAAGALAAAKRANDLFEVLLASNSSSVPWQDSLAGSYFWLGRAFDAQNKNAEALDAYQKYRDVVQKLADGNQGDARWQNELAVSYEKIGDTLIEQLRWDEALDAYRRNLAIRGNLADGNPANNDWQFGLAVAFGKIGNLFLKQSSVRATGISADASKSAEAIDAVRKELDILTKLTDNAPLNAQWLKELSIAYDALGDVLMLQNKSAEALDAYRKGLVPRQKLADSDQTNTDYQNGLAFSNDRIGQGLAAQRKWTEALDAFQNSLTIWQKLIDHDPDHVGYLSAIVGVRERVGNLFMAQRKNDGALQSYRNMLTVSQKLADGNQGDSKLQRGVAVSYERIGDVLMAQGKNDDARDAYQKELAIIQPLADGNQGTDWQFSLSIAYNKLGNAFSALGKDAEALDAYQKYQGIAQKLADAAPGDAVAQYHLSIAYLKIGDVYLKQDRNSDALDAYQKYRLTIQSIADRDPASTKWQSELAAGYERIGDAFRAAERYEEALGSFRNSLAISEKLAGTNPNAVSQRLLAILGGKIGAVLVAQGQITEALSVFQSGLAYWQKLADKDSANAQWQEGLAVTYQRIGPVLRGQDQLDEAAAIYEKLLATIKKLMAIEPDDVSWQTDLTLGYRSLGMVLFDLGRTKDALANFNAAVQIGKAPDNSELYWRRALAELYTDDAAAAVGDAATALKLNPSYPYYAIWLHVARARAGQDDADELAANAEKADRTQWPWPIVALSLGSMNPDEVKAAASAGSETTRLGQSCDADFFIGAYQIGKAAQADARPFFQSAADHCPHNNVEYPAAKLELRRLDERAGARGQQ